MNDWLAGYGPERPNIADTPPTTWRKGSKRRLVHIIVCEDCGSHHVRRVNEYGKVAYWQCETCTHRQKDEQTAGRDRASLA